MRNILLLVGSQSQGKSTFVRSESLEEHTLSYDTIRKMTSQKHLTVDGVSICEENNSLVHKIFVELLEKRMSNGSFTVIDNMNIRSKDITFYKNIAKRYGYRVWYKRFDRYPLDKVKSYNEHKGISHEVSEKCYNMAKELQINGITEIQEVSEIGHHNIPRTHDVSDYDRVVVIGDLHGCANELQEFVDKEYNTNTYYIFVGDYIDRGYDSPRVIHILSELYKNGNVSLLEGNHERWLRYWSNSDENLIRNRGFKEETVKQFESVVRGKNALTKKDARSFVNKLQVYDYIEYGDRTMFVCHGGVSQIMNGSTWDYRHLRADDYIKGEGAYNQLNELYQKDFIDADYMIHGHRNKNGMYHNELQYINLEGAIEMGGQLRYVVFCKETEPVMKTIKSNYDYSEMKLLPSLRQSDDIREKVLKPHLSSFNFTRDVFYKKKWNNITTKARGLFINTKTHKIVARSYDKFFNYEEHKESCKEAVQNMKSPFKVFSKPNGFLGIVSYDHTDETLLFCSKSTNKGEYAENFERLCRKHLDIEELTAWAKDGSLTFEVCDPINDPHIVKYNSEKLILLDFIENKPKFKKCDSILPTIANAIGSGLKKIYGSYDHKGLEDFLKRMRNLDYSEGFVIESSCGKMFKVKTFWYQYLKSIRGLRDRILKGDDIDLKQSKFLLYRYRSQFGCDLPMDRFEDMLKLSVENPDMHLSDVWDKFYGIDF